MLMVRGDRVHVAQVEWERRMQVSLLLLTTLLSASGAFLIQTSSTLPGLSIQERLHSRSGSVSMAATQPIKDLTLLFVRRVNANGGKEILLGLKKRGFGKGKDRRPEAYMNPV